MLSQKVRRLFSSQSTTNSICNFVSVCVGGHRTYLIAMLTKPAVKVNISRHAQFSKKFIYSLVRTNIIQNNMLTPIIVWMSYLLLNHKISYSSEQGIWRTLQQRNRKDLVISSPTRLNISKIIDVSFFSNPTIHTNTKWFVCNWVNDDGR